ncbi:hypothetical protein AB0G35_31680 [Streptomyces sp. NPDC021749]|uniref:hypothetical protein n=1 Tax=Streptomyces sp. NPDC021749 TaxID=3154905 RepID=UPI0033BFC82A
MWGVISRPRTPIGTPAENPELTPENGPQWLVCDGRHTGEIMNMYKIVVAAEKVH